MNTQIRIQILIADLCHSNGITDRLNSYQYNHAEELACQKSLILCVNKGIKELGFLKSDTLDQCVLEEKK